MENMEEHIEKYLQNRLSKDEKAKFEQRLKNDPILTKDIAFQKELQKAVWEEDQESFKGMVASFEVKQSQKSVPYLKWMVAASIVLVAGFTIFYTSFTKNDGNAIFRAYFEPYANVIVPIERGSNQKDMKSRAFAAYELGEYQKALNLFSDLLNKTQQPYYLFYKANCQLSLGRAKEAATLLLQHLETKDNLREKSYWYLALAYVKLENKKDAKTVLEMVIRQNSFRVNEAKELLAKLE